MRKILAAVALTGAALSMSAQPAAASGCYGVQGWATACYQGDISPTMGSWTFCVYTGGQYCENYSVPIPWVNTPYAVEVCAWLVGCTPV